MHNALRVTQWCLPEGVAGAVLRRRLQGQRARSGSRGWLSGPAFRRALVCAHETFTKGRSIFSRSSENGRAFLHSYRVHRRGTSPLGWLAVLKRVGELIRGPCDGI